MTTLAIHQFAVVSESGVLEVRSPDLLPGCRAEVIVLVEKDDDQASQHLGEFKASDLLDCGLVGIWADRTDLLDSVDFARSLRKQAEGRGESLDGSA